MIPDRAGNVEHWDLDKLIVILLRQFRRLLADRGQDLSDIEMRQISEQVVANELPAARANALCVALASIVDESLAVLAGRELSFAQSLRASMTDMSGWETTAEFLDVANEKANAEIRISAGSALMALLGDASRARYLIEAVEHDLQQEGRLDVDAAIARRALLFAANIDADADDWLERSREWARSQANR